MTTAADTLRRTPLYERHRAAGAKLVPFAGWEMPVQYAGIREEHMAVRMGAGVFDVSHMGEIETRGPQATELLQRLLSNDVSRIPEGGAQYSVLCREDGGVLDDLFTYRLGEHTYLTVTNAANHERDLEWFQAHAGRASTPTWSTASTTSRCSRSRARTRARSWRGLADGRLPTRMHVCERTRRRRRRAGLRHRLHRRGRRRAAARAPTTPRRSGTRCSAAGAAPVGLGARDTLRLEVCFHLYGNDLSEDRGPIEAGLGWCCKEATGFIGSEAVAAARAAGPAEKLVPFALTESGIARQGNPVVGGGEVTSGTLSPCMGIGIGMAYLPAERTEPGTPFEIDVRGKVRGAQVKEKPLYRKDAP